MWQFFSCSCEFIPKFPNCEIWSQNFTKKEDLILWHKQASINNCLNNCLKIKKKVTAHTYLHNLDSQSVIIWIAAIIEGKSHCFLPVYGDAVEVLVSQGQPYLYQKTPNIIQYIKCHRYENIASVWKEKFPTHIPFSSTLWESLLGVWPLPSEHRTTTEQNKHKQSTCKPKCLFISI